MLGIPAGADAVVVRKQLDAGVLREGLHDAVVAVEVGRVADEAAHVVDVALAAELLEQPARADIAVVELVVRDVQRVGIGDVGVDRDGLDAGGRAPRRGPGSGRPGRSG